MKREEYRSILGRLPIKTPTPQDMAMLCPHLTAEEAVEAFTTGSGYVALPPLRVHDAFQIASYHKEWVENLQTGSETAATKNHPAQLSWSYTGRNTKSQNDSPYLHMDKAIKFAEDNWGSELVTDDWNSVVEFYVQDPTDLVNDRYHKDYPRTKAILRVTLTRDLNDIVNDYSRPQSELLDEAISQMTLDHIMWHELKGGRGAFMEFNCANCGAGLSISSCNGCGYEFQDDHFRCGWNTPLSRKMVELLCASGHVFKVDPEIAWKKERHLWQVTKELLEKKRRDNPIK